MSTELTRSRDRGVTRFDRLALRYILALALVAATLGVLNSIQGPRLSSGEVNTSSLISRSGQRVLLHANQPLAKISPNAVQVSPRVVFDVESEGNTVAVRFKSALRYGTTYTITVNAQSATTGATDLLDLTFTTPDVDVLSLVRRTNEGVDDQLLMHSFSAREKSRPVVEAPRIQEYVRLGDRVAVVTLDDAGTPSLTIAGPKALDVIPINTSGSPTIRQLDAASSGDLFGYVLDSGFDAAGAPTANLHLYNLSGSGVPQTVVGIDGEPISVWDWAFVPGTLSIIVQDFDRQLFLIDTLTEGAPRPLGRHSELRGFLPGTVQLIVADSSRESIIDLSEGTTVAARLPKSDLPEGSYPSTKLLVSRSSFVQLYTEPSKDGAGMISVLVFANAEGTTELYRTAAPGSSIGQYCLSPNGQYLAVEVVSAEGEPDDYPVIVGYSASTINFIEIDGGGVRRGVNGFMPDWC